MEGWRDGGMEGWRDGGMEGWRGREGESKNEIQRNCGPAEAYSVVLLTHPPILN